MADDGREDDGTVLDARRMARILDCVEGGDTPELTRLLEPLHAADVADLLEQIGAEQRRKLLAMWSGEIDGDILSEISDSIREEVIESLPPDVVAEAMRDLDTDDVVDILEDLEEPAQAAILSTLESADRLAVEQALAYPEYSAGRLMQREVVTAPEHWTVGEMIDHLRSVDWLPDQFYHVILVDPRIKPVSYVTLGRLLSARRDVALKSIVEDSFRVIEAGEPEADVAYLFNQYHLISCPVVDVHGRLVGVITIDDAMNVLDEEHQEDMLRMAGVDDEATLADTVWEATKGRALWLFVNLLTAILASVVISAFAETIEQMVALAVLMPIVASMGGNAGTQSMTVAVRALATRDLTPRNAARVIRREVAVGAINGAVFGLLMALVAGVWFGVPMLAAVIGLAMVLTLVAAAFGGIAIPMALERAGIDPALASGPFVTTVTDVVGFFAFLGLASWMLL
ncbi:magnesium transporter [Pseudotabrizicola formosa]|uniref:magnesium transporter n=1 Tax=Pseudotabrizicola formosa TaxID=2030009 RepID=UPI000CD236F3|nr:magnesium transporter [Pseudotabrizicola formosa]